MAFLGGVSTARSLLLSFRDPQLEREFVEELDRARRHGSICIMFAIVALMVLEFLATGAVERLSGASVAAGAMHLSRLAAVCVCLVVLVLLRCGVVGMEKASLINCAVAMASVFASDPYRVSQVVGLDPFDHYGHSCNSVVSMETMNALALVGCTAVTVTFAAVRVSRSWALVVMTVLLHIVSACCGLGPISGASLWTMVLTYVIIVAMLWSRSYAQERGFRYRWLDNRRLRLAVQTQRRLREEQERWLNEVDAQLDALTSMDTAPPEAFRARDVDAILTVPMPRRRPRPELAPLETETAEPNAALAMHMAGRKADQQLVRRIVAQIRSPSYGMRAFFDDCVAAFPELELFCVDGSMSSGRAGHVEYQRTLGALFAVYWLLRLDGDGKFGLCYGCDEDWNILTEPSGNDCDKKRDFFDNMDWSLLQDLTDHALMNSAERIEAMLCLTAFHDIMKVDALVPRVSRAHAPYHAHDAGDCIHDHDMALAYVLEHHPELMPSFMVLPVGLQRLVLFTQTKLCFNHGWFVQAEGTPGAMLSSLKRVLQGGSGADLAFYFFHWVTDLSGAEGRPLAGAEKFTCRFARSVLISFVSSIPFLQRLGSQSETEVLESYLEARFRQLLPGEPLPMGEGAVALLRLAVMAQQGAALAVSSFKGAPEGVRRALGAEMALTGIHGQSFLRTPAAGGPAFLVYYGPAVLQRCKTLAEMRKAMTTLASVYDAARLLWPWDEAGVDGTVTIEVGALKYACAQSSEGKLWVLVRQNDSEAKLCAVDATGVNDLVRSGATFVCAEMRPGPAHEEAKAVEGRPGNVIIPGRVDAVCPMTPPPLHFASPSPPAP